MTLPHPWANDLLGYISLCKDRPPKSSPGGSGRSLDRQPRSPVGTTQTLEHTAAIPSLLLGSSRKQPPSAQEAPMSGGRVHPPPFKFREDWASPLPQDSGMAGIPPARERRPGRRKGPRSLVRKTHQRPPEQGETLAVVSVRCGTSRKEPMAAVQ